MGRSRRATALIRDEPAHNHSVDTGSHRDRRTRAAGRAIALIEHRGVRSGKRRTPPVASLEMIEESDPLSMSSGLCMACFRRAQLRRRRSCSVSQLSAGLHASCCTTWLPLSPPPAGHLKDVSKRTASPFPRAVRWTRAEDPLTNSISECEPDDQSDCNFQHHRGLGFTRNLKLKGGVSGTSSFCTCP